MVDYECYARPHTVSHPVAIRNRSHESKTVKKHLDEELEARRRRRPKSEPSRRAYTVNNRHDEESPTIPFASMVHKGLPYKTFSARLMQSRRYASGNSNKRQISEAIFPIDSNIVAKTAPANYHRYQCKVAYRDDAGACPLPFATPKSAIQYKPDTLPGYYKSTPTKSKTIDIPDVVTLKPEPHPSFTKIQQKVKVNYVQNVENYGDGKVPSYELLPTEIVKKKPTEAQPARFESRYSEMVNSRTRQKLLFVKSHRVNRPYHLAGTGVTLQSRTNKLAIIDSEHLICTPVLTSEGSIDYALIADDVDSIFTDSVEASSRLDLEEVREGAVSRLSAGLDGNWEDDEKRSGNSNQPDLLYKNQAPKTQYENREEIIYLDIKNNNGKLLKKNRRYEKEEKPTLQSQQGLSDNDVANEAEDVEDTNELVQGRKESDIVENPGNALDALGVTGKQLVSTNSHKRKTVPRRPVRPIRLQNKKPKGRYPQQNLSTLSSSYDAITIPKPASAPAPPKKSLVNDIKLSIEQQDEIQSSLDDVFIDKQDSSTAIADSAIKTLYDEKPLTPKRVEFKRTLYSESDAHTTMQNVTKDRERGASYSFETKSILKNMQRTESTLGGTEVLNKEKFTQTTPSPGPWHKSDSYGTIDIPSITKSSSDDGEFHRIHDSESESSIRPIYRHPGHANADKNSSKNKKNTSVNDAYTKRNNHLPTNNKATESKTIRIRSIGELRDTGYDPIALLNNNAAGLNKLESFLRMQSQSGIFNDAESTTSDAKSDLSIIMQSDNDDYDDDNNDFQLPAMYTFTSEPQSKAFQGKFEQLDLNGDGYISIEELREKMFASADVNAVKNLMNLFDLDGDGKIDIREFIVIGSLNDKVCGSRTTKVDTVLEFDLDRLAHLLRSYQEMFQLIDQDNDGYLLTSELSIMISAAIGIELGTNRGFVRRLIRLIDKDNSGTIDFVEFMTFIPFFVQLHQNVINKSIFDETAGQDQKGLVKHFEKTIKKSRKKRT